MFSSPFCRLSRYSQYEAMVADGAYNTFWDAKWRTVRDGRHTIMTIWLQHSSESFKLEDVVKDELAKIL